MANRRMFSKTITESDEFLNLPATAQALYFHIGMNTDDDGYCEKLRVMRLTLGCQDDIQRLQADKFIYVFDDKVILDLHFNENNQIRKDRKKDSKYTKLYPPSTICQPDDNQMTAQYSIGKVSIGKDIGACKQENPATKKKTKKAKNSVRRPDVPYEKIISDFNTKSGRGYLSDTEATMVHINNSWDFAKKHPKYKDDPFKAFTIVNSNAVKHCTGDQLKWLAPNYVYRCGPKQNTFEGYLNQIGIKQEPERPRGREIR